MSVALVDDVGRAGPALVQSPGGESRAGDGAPAVDEPAVNAGETIEAIEDRRVAEPVVGPVVRDEAEEPLAERAVPPARVSPEPAGADGYLGVLAQGPLARGSART